MQRMLDCISENQDITDAELQQLLGIKRTRFYLLASRMKHAGLIKISGRGKNKKYVKV